MQITRIGYDTDNEQEFTATILEKDKEGAIEFLRKMARVKRIKTVSAMGSVHAIGDSIIAKILETSPKVKKLNDRIENLQKNNKELDDQLKNVEYELEQIKTEADKRQQQLSSAELAKAMKEPKKIYVCPHCNKESDTKPGLKQHISKTHKE